MNIFKEPEVKLTKEQIKEQELAKLKMDMFTYFYNKCEAADLTGASQSVLDAKALLIESMKASGDYKKLDINFDNLITTYKENKWPKPSEAELKAEELQARRELKAAERAEELVPAKTK